VASPETFGYTLARTGALSVLLPQLVQQDKTSNEQGDKNGENKECP
jgi:hypothetical protein